MVTYRFMGPPPPRPLAIVSPPPLLEPNGEQHSLAGGGKGGQFGRSEINLALCILYGLMGLLSLLVGRIFWSNTPPPLSYHGQCGLLALLSLTLSVLCVAGWACLCPSWRVRGRGEGAKKTTKKTLGLLSDITFTSLIIFSGVFS